MVQQGKEWAIRRVSLVVALALVLAACGDAAVEEPAVGDEPAATVEGRPPTMIDLGGFWLLVHEPGEPGLLVSLRPNRTFAIHESGNLSDPEGLGTYELDGDTITFTGEQSTRCAEGESWAGRASLPQSGVLRIVHTEGAGICRVPLRTEWTLIMLSARPAAAVRELAVEEPAEAQPPTASDLSGIWLVVKGAPGLMAWFGRDGGFAVDDGGKLDTDPFTRASYTVDGHTIAFRSNGPGCPGDTWEWGEARLSPDGVLRIVHTVTGSGSCRVSLGTEWTFLRVSPGSSASAEVAAP